MWRPWGFQAVEAPRFQDNTGGKSVSLTHQPPLNPRKYAGTHICYCMSRPQGLIEAGIYHVFKNFQCWHRESNLGPSFHIIVLRTVNPCSPICGHNVSDKYAAYIFTVDVSSVIMYSSNWKGQNRGSSTQPTYLTSPHPHQTDLNPEDISQERCRPFGKSTPRHNPEYHSPGL